MQKGHWHGNTEFTRATCRTHLLIHSGKWNLKIKGCFDCHNSEFECWGQQDLGLNRQAQVGDRTRAFGQVVILKAARLVSITRRCHANQPCRWFFFIFLLMPILQMSLPVCCCLSFHSPMPLLPPPSPKKKEKKEFEKKGNKNIREYTWAFWNLPNHFLSSALSVFAELRFEIWAVEAVFFCTKKMFKRRKDSAESEFL